MANIERKLASVRRIAEILVHPNADALDIAVVDGWKLVTAKANGFKAGDLVVYFEIDSWIPTEIAPFLSKGKEPRVFEGVKGERLRTIKLRGELSQGLIIPIDETMRAEVSTALSSPAEYVTWEPEEGFDLTEILGIKKYEKELPAQLAGQAKGTFPSFIPRTDEERIQNYGREVFGYVGTKVLLENLTPDEALVKNTRGISEGRIVIEGDQVFAVHAASASPDDRYEVTLKMDGSSFTAYVKDGETGICSRNLELKDNEENAGNSFIATFNGSGLKNAMIQYQKIHGTNFAFQGELMGPGIQGNREKLDSFKVFLFKIWLIDEQRFATPTERYGILEELLALGADENVIMHTPIIAYSAKLGDDLGITDVDSALKFAERPSLNNPVAEGVVFKRIGSDFSFKAISNRYLLDEK